MSKKKNTTTARPASAASAPDAVPAAPDSGSGVAGAPVLRTGTDRALWAALGTNPGTTTAVLADASGIGLSTARRVLSGWETAGAVLSHSDATSPRAAKTWIAAETAPEPTTAESAGSEPGTGESAAPEPVTPEPAPAEPAAPEPISPAPVIPELPDPTDEQQAHADPDTDAPADPGPDTAPDAAVAAPTDGDPVDPAPVTPVPADDAATAEQESVLRLPAGALRGQVEDFLRDHPGEEYTPHQIGKVLERSSGAVHNALVTLTKGGTARQTSTAPKRFTLASA
ncbi:hypothetical protein [Nocardia vinacea]|uniref:hypothetical protein n=1 Tax=Nocardia vinacea TaxID=96468 RepID=UPI0012F6F7C5|nr:hypothetical protein [Nocardia vinacea]